jgi:hypothetical protein
MTWTPLPTGSFTGIDWSKPGATDGADPYLVWAEADQFAGYDDKHPKWLPIALELHANTSIADLVAAGSPKWLHVPPVYTSGTAPNGLRFCTARVRPEFFKQIRPGGRLHTMVKRLEMGLPAGPHAEGPDHHAPPDLPGTSGGTNRRAQRLLEGEVFGLIDDSIALAHANFLDSKGKARTAFFWRQDELGKGMVPAGLDYGHELTAADVDAAMRHHTYNGLVDESAVYTALGLSTIGKKWPKGRVQFHGLDTAVSHGTHVADLAVGPRTLQAQTANLPPGFDAPPSWATADDDASRAPIVAVQLDYDTVADTSGGSMNVSVLDGLMYILSRCAPTAKAVVNISFGTLAGPHDGTSLLEAAMDQLLALRGDRLQIVLAAGNSYQLRTHANVALEKNRSETLHWVVQPDDSSQSFVELWLAAGAEGIEIEITPPGRTALPPLKFGQSRMWLDDGQKPVCALIYPRRVSTGENGTCALVALAPSFSFKAATATAPSGVWKIKLTNTRAGQAVVDAYIERDDVVLGTHSGAKQSHFEDDPRLRYDEQYDMQAYVDDPTRITPIRRSGNFCSIATGGKTVSVGGVRMSDGSWAHYSPLKPDPDHARPERPGVVKMPDQRAFSDENAAATGVSAAGTRSGAVVRLRGTSDAAPQEARRLL